jgi:5'-nucleotidase
MGLSDLSQAAGPARVEGFPLTFIHTNDVHGSYGGYTQDGKICYQSICPDGTGGALRLERAIRALKAKYPDALVMDAGDQFLGTLYWRVHKEAATVGIMNLEGYQFFVPGNHEFDDGLLTFKKLVDSLQAQVISANLVIKDPKIKIPKLAPYAVVEIKGRKVGIIGLTTSSTESYGPLATGSSKKVPFELKNERETLAAYAKELSDLGVDIIVALTHSGLNVDMELAAQVSNVDVIVGGHSHSLLGDFKGADGPYPIMIKSPTGDPVLVVTAGSRGSYLGLLSVDFDAQGKVIKWSGLPMLLNDKALSRLKAPPADPQMSAYLEELSLPIHSLMEEKVGRISASPGESTLEADRYSCRKVECRTGDAIASSFLSYSKESQIALINAGSIRNPLPAGDISIGDVLSSFPYEDYAYKGRISGSDLWKVLQNSVDRQTQGSGGGFLQVAGLKVTYKGQPGAYTLKEVLVESGSKWLPLDQRAVYNIITLDFLAKGGDGFEIFKDMSWKSTDQLMSDIFVYYLENGPIDVNYDSRIIFEND